MDDDDDTGSILQQQRLYYSSGSHAPPPMYPHGDDPRAVPPRRQRRRKVKRKRNPVTADSDKDLTTKVTAATSNKESEIIVELKKSAEEFKGSEKALPASDLPEGFPQDLAFRAMAVYATLRTLSIQLRLSPFTPNAFLRALYLPYPNRLLGSVHVHILRILLSNLKMGYHWRDPSTTPTFEVFKKRKIDGIKWPLRAGDNFYYMDMYTWPLFYDDYCHLTADIFYPSIFDTRSHIDWRALNLHDIVDQVPYLDDLVDDEVVDSDEDYVYQDDEEEELLSDGDSSFERPKKKHKNKPKAKKKEPFANKGKKQQGSAVSSAIQNNRQQHLDAILSKNIRDALGNHQNGQIRQQAPHSSSQRPVLLKGYDQNYVVGNYERLQQLYRNNESVSGPVAGIPMDRPPALPKYVFRDFGSRIHNQFSPRNRNADFVTIRDASGNLQQAVIGTNIRPPVVAQRNSGAQRTHPSSPRQFQADQRHQMLVNVNRTGVPMQPMPTAGPNFAAHYRGPMNNMPVHHRGNMIYGPPPQVRPYQYGAHMQQGNREPNLLDDSSRPEEIVRHDTEGSLDFWSQLPIEELEPTPVFETVPSKEASREAEEPSMMNAAPIAFGPITSASVLQQEGGRGTDVSRHPAGNRMPDRRFGSNENPIEILDNDFDDEIVCDLLDGVTWEVKGKSSEAEKQAPVAKDAPIEANSQAYLSLPSTDLTLGFAKAALESIHVDGEQQLHTVSDADVKSASTVAPSSEPGVVPGRKKKYIRLAAECKVASEPAVHPYADTSAFLSPKYFDVECIHRQHVPKVFDIDTKKSPDTQCQLPIHKETNIQPSVLVNITKATLGKSSNDDPIAKLSQLVSTNQGLDDGSRLKMQSISQTGSMAPERRGFNSVPASEANFGDGNGFHASSTSESGSSGPPVVSDPWATVHVNLQPSNDDRMSSHLSTMKDHAVTFSAKRKDAADNFADLAAAFRNAKNAFSLPEGMSQVHNFSLGAIHRKVSEKKVEMPTRTLQKPSSRFVAEASTSTKHSLTYSLQAFIRRKRQSDALDVEKVDEAVADNDDVVSFDANEPDHWSHFSPLKALRSGLPYHRLSLVDKLVMLEYLVDELLSVDSIAAVFSERYTKLSRSDYLYGSKPSEADIQSLRDADGDDHDDLCAVCTESGDVVCCDGCVSVYHKECVGLPQSSDPPEIWYCPECEYDDPSSFGPLRGGQKSEVDWVFIGDFFVSSHIPALDEQRRELFESKLLAVHGFVFCQCISDSKPLVSRKDRCFVKPSIQPVLSAKNLQEILFPLGQHFSSKWPVKQVPVNGPVMWSIDIGGGLFKNYFKKKESYDPFVYKNLYFDAPIHLESIQRSKQSIAVERNIFSSVSTTSTLSDCISPEVTKDRHLVNILQSATILFDAKQVLKFSLLRIEDDLQKASLLDEFWTSREQKSPNPWKKSVKQCTSVRRLARLLLKLVDATHIRAFKGGWTHSAIIRSKGTEGKRLRESDFNKNDGSVQEEAVRRYWERGKVSNWTFLVAKSSMFIPGFRKALCVSKTFAKRKCIGRGLKRSSFVNEDKMDSTDLQTLGDSIFKTKSLKENDSEPILAAGEEITVTVDKLRNRKRLDVFDFPMSMASALNISRRLESQISEKMSSFSREAKLATLREVRWPCAGSKLFDPVGYLPSSAVRRLGRTGGSLFAPFVEYFSLHEVGQVAYFHIWRKRLLQCSSFEDLMNLFRILESYLDESVCIFA
jgi:PHD-finger/DDT domain